MEGVTVLERDVSGKIVAAAIHHRPLGPVLRFSARDPRSTRRRDTCRLFSRGDNMTAPLLFKESVTEQIPQSDRGPLSNPRMWSPITSSPILGSHDAVLGR